MEGVVRMPSALGITTGCPPSMIAIQELLVPRSMPNTFAMAYASKYQILFLGHNIYSKKRAINIII
jgi:hypothetical protein